MLLLRENSTKNNFLFLRINQRKLTTQKPWIARKLFNSFERAEVSDSASASLLNIPLSPAIKTYLQLTLEV